MKAVLISIQPQWCEKIASGKKTVEVRKTRPKLEPPFKCYIYCTKGRSEALWRWQGEYYYDTQFPNERPNTANGKVIGEFVCDKIFDICIKISKLDDLLGYPFPGTGLTDLEILQYLRNGRTGYGWHISDLVIYERPKPLSEFYKCGAPTIEELDEQLCNYCSRTDYGEKRSCSTPDGYWSCEGAWCEEAYTEYLDNEYVLTRPPQSWCYVEEE